MTPAKPSQKEVDEHNLRHIPFRAWRPDCVMGQAVSDPHKNAKEDGEKG